MPALRHPVVDGLFYPAAPAALRAQVADYLAAVGTDDNDAGFAPPKLLITPHAGHEYRGAVAPCAYAQLRRRRAPGIRSVEIDAMTRWIADELGPDVPLHFTAFHPDYKMLDRTATPPSTLTRARAIALGSGLHHVYTGIVHDIEGGTTLCPGCHAALIERDWYGVLRCDLDTSGACPHCGAAIAGRFGEFRHRFGRRRLPLRLAAA